MSPFLTEWSYRRRGLNVVKTLPPHTWLPRVTHSWVAGVPHSWVPVATHEWVVKLRLSEASNDPPEASSQEEP